MSTEDYKARIAAIDAQVTELHKERRELKRMLLEEQRQVRQQELAKSQCCHNCQHVVIGYGYKCTALPVIGYKGTAFTRCVSATRDRSKCPMFSWRTGEIFHTNQNNIEVINELKRKQVEQ